MKYFRIIVHGLRINRDDCKVNLKYLVKSSSQGVGWVFYKCFIFQAKYQVSEVMKDRMD